MVRRDCRIGGINRNSRYIKILLTELYSRVHTCLPYTFSRRGRVSATAIFGGEPLLKILSATDRNDLLSLGSDRRYATDQRILDQGNDDRFVVLIRRGWTVVRAEAENGRSVIFGLCGPLDIVGEMAAFDGKPRSATVTALVEVHGRVVPSSDFLAFLRARPHAYEAAVRSLSSRLRAADDQSQTLATLTVLQRLARLLLDLDGGAGTRAGAELNQHELAAAIGATRESVAKALAALRARAVLRSEGRRIIIADRGALQAIALL